MRTTLNVLTGLVQFLALSAATPCLSSSAGVAPYPSSGGTSVRPKTPCYVTTTTTSTEYLYFTTGSVGSTVTFTSATIVNGDTLTPTNGTATATVPTLTTFTNNNTQTQVELYYPSTSVGHETVVTAPTPSGFLPVQSTLPNATYCKLITVTETSTFRRTDPPTYSTTLSGTLIEFDSGMTTYTSASDFTNFSIAFSTTTYTNTAYGYSLTTTSTVTDETFTITASTTTIYPACATNNFANIIIRKNSTNAYINAPIFTAPIANIGDSPGDDSASACCAIAVANGYDAWTYIEGLGCTILYTGPYFFYSDPPPPCTPANTSLGVFASPQKPDFFITVGNAGCARFNRASLGQGNVLGGQ